MYCSNPECPDILATGALVSLVSTERAEEARATDGGRARPLGPEAARPTGPPVGLDGRADGPR
jgi:hypothetical protein